MELGDHPARMLEDMDELLARYRLAVIDLGVVRLDPRMLALARPNDPTPGRRATTCGPIERK